MIYPPPITEGFREELRYEYDLKPDSLVIDAGAHKGEFSKRIYKQYGCNVEAYEPITEFVDRLAFVAKKLLLLPYAIGTGSDSMTMGLSGDSTGFYSSGKIVTVSCIDISTVIRERIVDLLKLNVEGAEYGILDAINGRGLAKYLRNIQVQFHRNIPNYERRWFDIRTRLLKTHHLAYDFPFCWENYALNE